MRIRIPLDPAIFSWIRIRLNFDGIRIRAKIQEIIFFQINYSVSHYFSELPKYFNYYHISSFIEMQLFVHGIGYKSQFILNLVATVDSMV